MPFRFTLDDPSPKAALRRIAGEQTAAALKAAGGDGPLAPRIHTMRKSVKKLRGLIRLVRPVFPDFDDENRALRDAGRLLAPLRESDVLARTLADLLAETGRDPAEAAALLPDAGRDGPPPGAEAAIIAYADAMAQLAARARQWKPRAKGFDALAPGLEKTLRQAARTLKAARRDPSDAALHEWRKRVKDHWYQARLLRPIWPEAMSPHADAADRLGEALGDHHDLGQLAAALPAGAATDPLIAAARARQTALEAEATTFGRRLLADSPACLAARWRVWWDVWRGA